MLRDAAELLETLGPRLRGLRRKHGITQRDVADHLGINFTYVSKIENDRLDFPCSDSLLRGLAALYEVDPDELLALAGRVPQDIIDRLRGDLAAIKKFRSTFGT